MVYYTIDELLAMPQIPVTESDRRLIYCLFDRMPALKNAKRQHDDKDAEWIVTLLSTVMDSMPSLLASMARRSNRDRIDRMARMMKVYNECALFLLQGSPFLRNLNGEARSRYQHMLTAIVENAESYCRAFDIVKQGNEAEEIQGIFDNLAS